MIDRFKYYVILVFMLMIFMPKVWALSVSSNNLTIEKGKNESVSLYANTDADVKSVSFSLVYSSYDVPADFFAGDGLKDQNNGGTGHSITFDVAKKGKIFLGTVRINVKNDAKVDSATINIHSAKAITVDSKNINLDNQNITVTVSDTKQNEVTTKKEEVEKVTNLLDKIESKIVNIELKENVFDYTVSIDSSVTELDLKPIAKDKETKIEVSNQVIKDIKDNKITITLTNGDVKQQYTINFKVKKVNEVVIDKTIPEVDKSYKKKWIIMCGFGLVVLLVGLVLNKRK